MRVSAWKAFVPALVSVVAAVACSDTTTSASPSEAEKTAVVKGYAALVRANYDAAIADMKTLQRAIDAFVASPSQGTLDAARSAWTAARPSYLQSEAYRFYNGPIDEVEAAINSWPLDENYVDETAGQPGAGIVNMPAEFPAITKEVIAAQNQKTGEKNVSCGWHAIEFLLWGQDTSATGPGSRPFTDFVDGGTAKNHGRRRDYLKAVTDLMVEQMEAVGAQWRTDDAQSYAAKMIAGSADTALGNILKGIGSLAGTELPKERMNNAYQTKDQEEEHSCFSDTTNQDLVFNGTGIENVYLGRYGSAVTEASLSDLVKAKDAALDAKTRTDLAAALDATKAIPKPFDQAILGADDADGRKKIKAAIDAWAVVTGDIVKTATVLGITINLEEP